jgi:hypothetical protein
MDVNARGEAILYLFIWAVTGIFDRGPGNATASLPVSWIS